MEQLRELQLAQVDILKEIHRVCEKLGIKYTLSCGTALGAVRHNGFIPWDDDIDIAMIREDYNRFIKYAKQELESNYFIQTYETDPQYTLEFAKVRNSLTTMIEGQTQSLKINKGVYIDIFPIDRASKYKHIRRIDNFLLSVINIIKFSCTKEYCEKSSNRFVRKIRKAILPVSKMIGTQKLCYIETKLMSRHNKSNSNITFGESIQGVPAHRIKDDKLINISIFEETIKCKFEKEEFYIVKEYDEYLSTLYGDYMKLPPKEKQVPHHNIVKLDLSNGYMKYESKC